MKNDIYYFNFQKYLDLHNRKLIQTTKHQIHKIIRQSLAVEDGRDL